CASFGNEVAGNLGELVVAPLFRFPDRARRHDHDIGAADVMLSQEYFNTRNRRLRERKLKKRKFSGQTQERADIQKSIVRVQIERGHWDTMGIGHPASLPCALPSVLARLLWKFSRRGIPDAGARPVKSDARWCAGGESQGSRAKLAMHIDNQII